MDPLHIVALSVLGTLITVGSIYGFVVTLRMSKEINQHIVLFQQVKEMVPANVHVLNQLRDQNDAILGSMGQEEEEEDRGVIGFMVDGEEDEEEYEDEEGEE